MKIFGAAVLLAGTATCGPSTPTLSSSLDAQPATVSDAFGAGVTAQDLGISAPARIKILTVNLKNPAVNSSDAEKRMQIIADAIVLEKPDFVALQECTQDKKGNR